MAANGKLFGVLRPSSLGIIYRPLEGELLGD